MIAIFWFSAQPDLPHAPGALLDFLLKKGLHAAAYGILAVLWLRPLRAAGVARSELWALVLTVAYAATDELHQTRVPGRTGRLVDVAIDAAGALSALILWKRVSRTPEG
jgi:VanZ family protein